MSRRLEVKKARKNINKMNEPSFSQKTTTRSIFSQKKLVGHYFYSKNKNNILYSLETLAKIFNDVSKLIIPKFLI